MKTYTRILGIINRSYPTLARDPRNFNVEFERLRVVFQKATISMSGAGRGEEISFLGISLAWAGKAATNHENPRKTLLWANSKTDEHNVESKWTSVPTTALRYFWRIWVPAIASHSVLAYALFPLIACVDLFFNGDGATFCSTGQPKKQ